MVNYHLDNNWVRRVRQLSEKTKVMTSILLTFPQDISITLVEKINIKPCEIYIFESVNKGIDKGLYVWELWIIISYEW